MSSIVSQRPRDCLACRVVSGGGLLGAGAYIAFHSTRAKHRGFKLCMNLLALATAGLGTARLLNLPPFNKSHQLPDE